jgi:Na+/H+ antiporter NhaD/arsenite permease-like protein
MSMDGWFTVGLVGLVLLALMLTQLAPDVILVAGLTALMLSGILSPDEALAGLANEGMVTVGVLFIVGAGVRETGSVDWIAHRLFGRPQGRTNVVMRLMAPVAALSAFMNNTPLVAMLIPAVADWAKQLRIPVSRVMIPLSFAAILGGTCTLIGTSTNLVVNGPKSTPTCPTVCRCSTSPGWGCLRRWPAWRLLRSSACGCSPIGGPRSVGRTTRASIPLK